MQLEADGVASPDKSLDELLNESAAWEGKNGLSGDDATALQETLKKLRSALLFERQKNAFTDAVEEKERSLLFEGYAQTTKDGKIWKELEQRKNEEIAQLQEELTRRKGWIMEVERQRGESAEVCFLLHFFFIFFVVVVFLSQWLFFL